MNELATWLQGNTDHPGKKAEYKIRKALTRALKNIKEKTTKDSSLYIHLEKHLPVKWPIQYSPENPIEWET